MVEWQHPRAGWHTCNESSAGRATVDKHCMNRAYGALVHRLMHTSVEKHSLRIVAGCGTLTHASRFNFLPEPMASVTPVTSSFVRSCMAESRLTASQS